MNYAPSAETEHQKLDSGRHLPRNRENDYSREQAALRRDFIREKTGIDMQAVSACPIDPAVTRGNIENFIGVAQVPLGLAEPMRIRGEYANSESMQFGDDCPMDQLLEHSITYRIAVGPQQGRKVFTLQTLPDCESDNSSPAIVGKTVGFSLHAGVATQANEREKLERLCRYITLRLDTEIIRLQHDFGAQPSHVRFTLRAYIVDNTTRRVLAWQEFDATVAAACENPYGRVIAANRAVQTVLEQLARFCTTAAGNWQSPAAEVQQRRLTR
jgi:hypothetical protein